MKKFFWAAMFTLAVMCVTPNAKQSLGMESEKGIETGVTNKSALCNAIIPPIKPPHPFPPTTPTPTNKQQVLIG